jgi:hypothetical protein
MHPVYEHLYLTSCSKLSNIGIPVATFRCSWLGRIGDSGGMPADNNASALASQGFAGNTHNCTDCATHRNLSHRVDCCSSHLAASSGQPKQLRRLPELAAPLLPLPLIRAVKTSLHLCSYNSSASWSDHRCWDQNVKCDHTTAQRQPMGRRSPAPVFRAALSSCHLGSASLTRLYGMEHGPSTTLNAFTQPDLARATSFVPPSAVSVVSAQSDAAGLASVAPP